MTREERIRNAIRPFVPDGTTEPLAAQILKHRCQLIITRERKTKLGDYRHPYGKHGHRISVNGTLNPYAFLITFVHELAHLHVWEQHRSKVRPHGREWKRTFRETMEPYLTERFFPEDILKPLRQHMRDPAAATVRDPELMRALRMYDPESETVILDELAVGTEFILGKRKFKKGERLRTRYRCMELRSGKAYLVNGIAEVLPA